MDGSKQTAIQCVICKQGETLPGTTNVILEHKSATVVINSVPADICENCGEYYLSEEMADKVLAMAEDTVAHGAEIEVRWFAA